MQASKGGISMRKRLGTVTGETRNLPIEKAPAPNVKTWRPSGLKTGLKNYLIGKKVSLVVLPTPDAARRGATRDTPDLIPEIPS